MVRPEDDARRFWVFTKDECGHTVGVLTDEGYDRQQALVEMYGGKREAKKALFDMGVDVRLIDAPEFHEQVSEAIRVGCTCPKS